MHISPELYNLKEHSDPSDKWLQDADYQAEYNSWVRDTFTPEKSSASFSTMSGNDPMQRTASFPTLSVTELMQLPDEPLKFLVPGLIIAGEPTLLYADGGAGKSFIALQLAIACATSGNWLGMPVEHGPALFVSCEDDEKQTRLRVKAIAKQAGFDPFDTPSLHISFLQNLPDNSLAVSYAPNEPVRPTSRFNEISELIARLKPVLVVIDNASDAFSGDENSKIPTRSFVRLFRELGRKYNTTILILAHPSRAGMQRGDFSAGSVSWSNSIRSRITIEPKKGEDLRTISLRKSNHTDLNTGQISIRFEGGCFVRADDAHVPMRTEGQTNKVIDILTDIICDEELAGRRLGVKHAANFAPAVCAKHPRGNGISRAAFEEAMKAALQRGILRLVETGPPTKRRQHLEVAQRSQGEA